MAFGLSILFEFLLRTESESAGASVSDCRLGVMGKHSWRQRISSE